jgi:hypothetical protein
MDMLGLIVRQDNFTWDIQFKASLLQTCSYHNRLFCLQINDAKIVTAFLALAKFPPDFDAA